MDPPPDALYSGPGFGENDGFPPLYLKECRERHVPSALVFAKPDERMLNATHEMRFTWLVNVELDAVSPDLPVHEFMFVVKGADDMPPLYEAVLSDGDYWSLGLDAMHENKVLHVEAPPLWSANHMELTDGSSFDGSSFVTFTYHGRDAITMRHGIEFHGFKLKLAMKHAICESVGWIAKSLRRSGRFDGFGTLRLC